MSKEKWNDVWKIMKSGRLEFDSKCNNDMLCIICKKVLINAHNGPCGCRYCLECITKYLNGEKKICPGNKDYCKYELLDIKRDIHVDQPMNLKIMETIVKCPQKSCDFETELINIEDHMRICDTRSFECPYSNIGCKEFNVMNTDIKKHMLMEIVSHTKLLFELIDNLKNEIKMIKKDNFELEKNNNDLKKYLKGFQLKYENDKEEIEEKLTEMKEQKNVAELKAKIKIMNDEIEFLKKNTSTNKKCINESKLKSESENREMKEKLKKIKNNLVEKQNVIEKEIKIMNVERESMKKDLFDNKKLIDDSILKHESESREIKKAMKEMDNKCNGKRRNIEELQKDIKMMKEEEESMKKDLYNNNGQTVTKIDELKQTITDLNWISNDSKTSISDMVKQMRVVERNIESLNCKAFVWCIDKWKDKTRKAEEGFNTVIDSEAFYSHEHGYNMRISVWPNGCDKYLRTHLSVECDLMRGKWDDILPWPFKHDVTFELINQHTAQIHTSCTLRYNNEKSDGISYCKDIRKLIDKVDKPIWVCDNLKFISLEELSNNGSLIENDQIFISCRVKLKD